MVSHPYTHLDSKLELLVRLAFADAFHLGRMQAVEFVFVLPLLAQQTLCQGKLRRKCSLQFGLPLDFSDNVPIHPTQKNLQTPDLTLCPFRLASIRVPANPHQGQVARATVALLQPYTMFPGKMNQSLPTAVEQTRICGIAIAFSCTVVSMVTRSRLLALTAPLIRPACTVICRINSGPFSPMRLRKQLSDEGSMGNL